MLRATDRRLFAYSNSGLIEIDQEARPSLRIQLTGSGAGNFKVALSISAVTDYIWKEGDK